MVEPAQASILVVDDEEPIRFLLGRFLEEQGYHCTVASSARQARERLKERPYALMLCDVLMPAESGLDLIKEVLPVIPDLAVLMATGLDDLRVATIALELGAYGYLIKPIEPDELIINVKNALYRRKLEIENRSYREGLEHAVLERTVRLQETVACLEQRERELQLAQEETIQRLARAVEFRDGETAEHVERMSRYSALLAGRLGWGPERCELVRLASSLHDIGKIGTPDEVLLEPGQFKPEAMSIIQQHPSAGYRILSGSKAELLRLAAVIAWTHHERYDGSGYPRALARDAIPIEGRIASIADVFDALTNKRPYKPAYPVDQAIEIMREGRATQFDPDLLDLFLGSMDDVLAIKARFIERTYSPAI